VGTAVATTLTPPPAARAYSSQQSNPASVGKLAGLAVSSAAVAFSLTMAYNYYKRPDNVAKLDMVPNVVAIETGGENWDPVHAREQDDAQVCLGHGLFKIALPLRVS
jgi:hypothetical protein